MNITELQAIQRIQQIGGNIILGENPCPSCPSLPACRLVNKVEHTHITPGSVTCQQVAQAEEESAKS